MIATRHDYSRLNFLIIDDFPNFCSALRNMVMSYGAEQIDVVHNGDEAIRSLSFKKYDVVLCDYNLGEGRNGNDILEEAKQQGLLKSAALFMMLTAESAAEMVRGALEYQPDDYLTKPFTKEVLLTRLERLLERNRIFRDIFLAIDKEKFDQAVDLCDDVMTYHPRYNNFTLKLKADLLMSMQRYEEARHIYNEILVVKQLPWAKLGLGKTFFHEEKWERALKTFQQLVQEDRGYVQAWDWLSKVQVKLGDKAAAQSSLQAAVKISPINVRRQVSLGDLALSNGDVERAEMAFNRSVKIGKHSVYRTPETYLKLTDIIVTRLEQTEGLANKRLELKAAAVLDEVRGLYKGDSQVQMQSRLMDRKVHLAQGHESEAERALLRAYDLCKGDQQGFIPGALKEELITALEASNRQDMADKLVAGMQQEESNFNTQAIVFYEQGNLAKALGLLKQAVTDKPRSYAINLNLVQVGLHLMTKEGVDMSLLEQVKNSLNRVEGLPENDRRFAMYTNLKKKYFAMQRKADQQHD